MDTLLHDDEDIHSLDINDLRIMQNKYGFRFGMDAVLLSDFAKDIGSGKKVMDLCSGNGIISLLLSAKLKNPSIVSVEIQQDVAELANRNVVLNHLESCVSTICMDLKKLHLSFPANSFDAVVCNPPYKKVSSGVLNDLGTKTIARHEVCCTLDDIARQVYFLLKPKGNFYMVHRPDRLSDIFCTFRKYHLEPKIMRLVQPSFNKAPNMVLLKAVKDARPFLQVKDSLCVYNDDGSYTNDVLKIYNVDK